MAVSARRFRTQPWSVFLLALMACMNAEEETGSGGDSGADPGATGTGTASTGTGTASTGTADDTSPDHHCIDLLPAEQAGIPGQCLQQDCVEFCNGPSFSALAYRQHCGSQNHDCGLLTVRYGQLETWTPEDLSAEQVEQLDCWLQHLVDGSPVKFEVDFNSNAQYGSYTSMQLVEGRQLFTTEFNRVDITETHEARMGHLFAPDHYRACLDAADPAVKLACGSPHRAPGSTSTMAAT